MVVLASLAVLGVVLDEDCWRKWGWPCLLLVGVEEGEQGVPVGELR